MDSFVRDPQVWTKTEEEKKLLKIYRKAFKNVFGNWAPKKKKRTFPGKLIVQVKGMPKSTYSHKCNNIDVPEIINDYKNIKNVTIIKCFWNDQEIDPQNIQIWGI